jgi:uncharacterized protein (TIGR02611 family)
MRTASRDREIRTAVRRVIRFMPTDTRQPARARAASPQLRPEPPQMVKKLQRRRATHRDHGTIYRAAFVVAGAALLLCGLAMLVLPGPAFLVLPIGLAILSLEFAWAGRLLDTALVQAGHARTKAANTSDRQKILTAIAIAALAAAFVVAAILYDIPVLPV